jgi:lipid-A-disaccharide synthase-like uncharacterized protein
VLTSRPGGPLLSGFRSRVSFLEQDNVNANGHFLQPYLGQWLPFLYTSSYWWTVLGFVGNILFSSRFFLQWLASERQKKVIVPSYFWYLSFWGSVLNLIYALHIDNATIIFGVIALPIIYGRNIILLHSARKDGKRPKEPLLRTRLDPA